LLDRSDRRPLQKRGLPAPEVRGNLAAATVRLDRPFQAGRAFKHLRSTPQA
jgi:hypothetical protein